MQAFGIDTSHFTRSVPGKRKPRLRADDVLVRLSPHAARVRPHLLRRALREIGRPYRCDGCGITGEWRGSPLILEVDHIDGDRLDNRPAKLRFLCPNCHAQTDTCCGNNKRRQP